MKRWACGLVVLTVCGVLSQTEGPAGAQGSRTPTVKEVMERLHKGANSPLTTIRADLQADLPDWPEVQKAAKDFVTLGAALGKNNPPKGDRQSWARLTAQYLENAKALDAAAQRRDQKAALVAHSRLNESCKGCHSAHRPN
ncbi:MAG TPA: cytochrome c [Gemmataceae bacterium]|nr:cytochrome c [Gemmataceae bacterium]